MKTYRAWFSTDTHTAEIHIRARNPKQALAQAVDLAERQSDALPLVPVERITAADDIYIMDSGGVVRRVDALEKPFGILRSRLPVGVNFRRPREHVTGRAGIAHVPDPRVEICLQLAEQRNGHVLWDAVIERQPVEKVPQALGLAGDVVSLFCVRRELQRHDRYGSDIEVEIAIAGRGAELVFDRAV